MKNCRCCSASYKKDGGDTNAEWCVLPVTEKIDGKVYMVEPVGFCDMCDKNNKVWYIPNKKCHYETN